MDSRLGPNGGVAIHLRWVQGLPGSILGLFNIADAHTCRRHRFDQEEVFVSTFASGSCSALKDLIVAFASSNSVNAEVLAVCTNGSGAPIVLAPSDGGIRCWPRR